MIAFILLVSILGIGADADSAIDHIECRLVCDSPEICAFDHLLVKSVITSHWRSAVIMEIPPAVGYEIRFEQQKWRKVHEGNPLSPEERLPEKLSIMKDESIAIHDLLFSDGNEEGFYFAKEGKYEIRARGYLLFGEVVSKPIVVTVTKRPPDEIAAIRGHWTELLSWLGARAVPDDTLPDEMLALRAKLTSGNIKTTLDRLQEASAYVGKARRGPADAPHFEVYKKMVAKRGEVESEFVAFHFIRFCLKMKDIKSVRQLQGAIRHECRDSRYADRMIAEIEAPPLPKRE